MYEIAGPTAWPSPCSSLSHRPTSLGQPLPLHGGGRHILGRPHPKNQPCTTVPQGGSRHKVPSSDCPEQSTSDQAQSLQALFLLPMQRRGEGREDIPTHGQKHTNIKILHVTRSPERVGWRPLQTLTLCTGNWPSLMGSTWPKESPRYPQSRCLHSPACTSPPQTQPTLQWAPDGPGGPEKSQAPTQSYPGCSFVRT